MFRRILVLVALLAIPALLALASQALAASSDPPVLPTTAVTAEVRAEGER